MTNWDLVYQGLKDQEVGKAGWFQSGDEEFELGSSISRKKYLVIVKETDFQGMRFFNLKIKIYEDFYNYDQYRLDMKWLNDNEVDILNLTNDDEILIRLNFEPIAD